MRNWIILHMKNGIGWCDKRGQNDQGTRWPGDEMTGDEMNMGQNDRDEMTGTKWKGRNRRLTKYMQQ
jgi:hypothetical protein